MTQWNLPGEIVLAPRYDGYQIISVKLYRQTYPQVGSYIDHCGAVVLLLAQLDIQNTLSFCRKTARRCHRGHRLPLTMHLRDYGCHEAPRTGLPARQASTSPSVLRHRGSLYVQIQRCHTVAKNGVSRVLRRLAARCGLYLEHRGRSSHNPDGFSNGPGGDPEQRRWAAFVLGKVPVFGICLGNQMLSIVAGADIQWLATMAATNQS